MSTELTETKGALINIGTLPMQAEEIFNYVKGALIERGTPLKEDSLFFHAEYAGLPTDWRLWTAAEAALASKLYDDITEHLAKITNAKGTTELDTIKNKAHKLHTGITAAITDIKAGTSEDKDKLALDVRAWRRREEERAAEEARKQQEEENRREEERKLAEAALLEAEALKHQAQGNTETAEAYKAEAENVISSPVDAPQVKAAPVIPSGGPRAGSYWSAEVISLKMLCQAVAAGTVPEQAIMANTTFLNNQARALKKALNYPGVRPVEK
jgi:hypothetical protein